MVIDRIVAQYNVFLEGRLRFGIEQLLDHSVVTLSRFRFNLRPARAKSSAAQEVPSQGNIFLVSHRRLLTA
jgi:hypothetical protein